MTDITVSGVGAVVAALRATVGDNAVERVVRNLGEATKTAARNAIETSKSPDGSTFKPLKDPRTRGRKGTTDHPLLNTGEMMRRLTYTTGSSGSPRLRVLSPHEYAEYHMSGTRHMSARRFLPVDPSWYQRRVERLMRRWGAIQ